MPQRHWSVEAHSPEDCPHCPRGVLARGLARLEVRVDSAPLADRVEPVRPLVQRGGLAGLPRGAQREVLLRWIRVRISSTSTLRRPLRGHPALAKCGGVTTCAQFAGLLSQPQRLAVGCFYRSSRQFYTTPAITTFHNILATLPPETLESAVAEWARQQDEQTTASDFSC